METSKMIRKYTKLVKSANSHRTNRTTRNASWSFWILFENDQHIVVMVLQRHKNNTTPQFHQFGPNLRAFQIIPSEDGKKSFTEITYVIRDK